MPSAAIDRDSTIMLSRWLEMAGDGGARWVGEIVRRHVDRLDRRDRDAANRRNAFLQGGDLGCKRRLVADPRGEPSEKTRNLAAGLNEAEYVVHQQQHILVFLIAKVF